MPSQPAGILKTVNPNPVIEGGFLIGAFEALRSSESIVLGITAVALPAGTRLGKITSTGLYVPIAPAASDGSQNWAGDLFEERPISAATQKAAIVARGAIVNGRLMTYINAVNNTQKLAVEAQAAAAGVITRY
jgi:hypothetical protein